MQSLRRTAPLANSLSVRLPYGMMPLGVLRANAIPDSADKQMIVFSDLDGSLLDHDTYSWEPARPALERLKEQGIPLVLVSSKTLAELDDYRCGLGIEHPVVAENGAAIWVPPDYFAGLVGDSGKMVSREELQTIYGELKVAGSYDCQAFFELGIPGIVRETGLTEAQAARANDRAASEPILWLDSDDRAEQFMQAVRDRGLRCVRGGRFMHLMADTGKEDAVRELMQAYSREWPERVLTSVSLGDGPNDLGMLATTDFAVIIPGRHEHPMPLTSNNRILRPSAAGPAGWNEAMLEILAEYSASGKTANSNGE